MLRIFLPLLLASLVSAQSTLQLFIDNRDPSAEWGASVIEVRSAFLWKLFIRHGSALTVSHRPAMDQRHTPSPAQAQLITQRAVPVPP